MTDDAREAVAQDITKLLLAEFKPGTVYLPDSDTLTYLEQDATAITVDLPSHGAAVLWNADRTEIIGVEIYGASLALAAMPQQALLAEARQFGIYPLSKQAEFYSTVSAEALAREPGSSAREVAGRLTTQSRNAFQSGNWNVGHHVPAEIVSLGLAERKPVCMIELTPLGLEVRAILQEQDNAR